MGTSDECHVLFTVLRDCSGCVPSGDERRLSKVMRVVATHRENGCQCLVNALTGHVISDVRLGAVVAGRVTGCSIARVAVPRNPPMLLGPHVV
jgi:hypothetical protein